MTDITAPAQTATTTATTRTAGTASAPNHRSTLATGAGLGIGLALVANLAVYAVGNLGAPTRVITGWEPDGADLGFGSVVAATVSLALLGTAALWLFDRLWGDGFHRWAALAAGVAIVSIPPVLRLDIDAASKVTLSVMHLVVGATVILGHYVARRRAVRRGHGVWV